MKTIQYLYNISNEIRRSKNQNEEENGYVYATPEIMKVKFTIALKDETNVNEACGAEDEKTNDEDTECYSTFSQSMSQALEEVTDTVHVEKQQESSANVLKPEPFDTITLVSSEEDISTMPDLRQSDTVEEPEKKCFVPKFKNSKIPKMLNSAVKVVPSVFKNFYTSIKKESGTSNLKIEPNKPHTSAQLNINPFAMNKRCNPIRSSAQSISSTLNTRKRQKTTEPVKKVAFRHLRTDDLPSRPLFTPADLPIYTKFDISTKPKLTHIDMASIIKNDLNIDIPEDLPFVVSIFTILASINCFILSIPKATPT